MAVIGKKMKIAMFWDFDPTNLFKWDTPSGIYREFKNAGHEVKKFPLPSYNKALGFNIFLKSGFKPDFCFLMNAGKLKEGEQFWNKKTLGDIPLVLEAGDEPQTFYDHIILSKNSDIVLTPDFRCFEMYKNKNINAFWWTHWCDEKIFFKDETQNQNISNDVVSSMYGIRPITNIVSTIIKEKFVNKTGLFDKENGHWLRSGKIVLQEARYGEITRRIFEGAGCAKLVMTNKLHPSTKLQEIFVDKEEIVYYNNPEECIELINFYLQNDKERERIANNGYKKIIENHTAEKRTFFVLEKIQELL
jgi:hypothetical protein